MGTTLQGAQWGSQVDDGWSIRRVELDVATSKGILKLAAWNEHDGCYPTDAKVMIQGPSARSRWNRAFALLPICTERPFGPGHTTAPAVDSTTKLSCPCSGQHIMAPEGFHQVLKRNQHVLAPLGNLKLTTTTDHGNWLKLPYSLSRPLLHSDVPAATGFGIAFTPCPRKSGG